MKFLAIFTILLVAAIAFVAATAEEDAGQAEVPKVPGREGRGPLWDGFKDVVSNSFKAAFGWIG